MDGEVALWFALLQSCRFLGRRAKQHLRLSLAEPGLLTEPSLTWTWSQRESTSVSPCSSALTWKWWFWRRAGIAQCPAGLRERDECRAAHEERAATDSHCALPLLFRGAKCFGLFGEKWEGSLCKGFRFPALCCDEAPPKKWQPTLGVSSGKSPGDSLLNKGGGNV